MLAPIVDEIQRMRPDLGSAAQADPLRQHYAEQYWRTHAALQLGREISESDQNEYVKVAPIVRGGSR